MSERPPTSGPGPRVTLLVSLGVGLVAVIAVAAVVWGQRGDGSDAAATGSAGSTTPDPTGSTNAAEAPPYVAPTAPAPTAAGPLSSADVPEPSVIGQGFATYADPGGAEAGWIGNGTFVHGRDAHEAAFGVLPLGCKERLDVDLPIPSHALQASYHGPHARPAQVVVLDFATTNDATAYFGGYSAMLAHCTEPDGPSGVAVVVQGHDDTSFVGTRTYSGSEVWSEVDVLTGTRVAVLLSSVPIRNGAAVVPSLEQAVAAR